MRSLRHVAPALAALLVSSAPAVAAEDAGDAMAIVERAFEAAKANEVKAREYVFHERIETRRFNRRGGERRREARTWDVTLFEGGDYRRLIAIDDRPLLPATEAAEERKLARHIAKLERETPRQRRRRLEKIEKGRQEGEAFLEEITRAFDFRLVGEEAVGGVACHVISAEPRPGYRPPSRMAQVLPKVRATLWVSKEDDGWVQAEIEVFDSFSWYGIYKLRSGTRVQFTQRKHDDAVWLTERWRARLAARIGFVYRYDAEILGSYDNIRRFTTETTSDWRPAE